MTQPNPLTNSLVTIAEGGDGSAAERFLPEIYDELRALAASYLRRERSNHTLQPTALVHEAYMRMVQVERVDWRGKSHFFAMAARQMRRILIDHARMHRAGKRGDGIARVTLDDGLVGAGDQLVELLALDEALAKLAAQSERQAQVAELRLFGGLTVEETAAALDVSPRTVKGDWRVARAWLTRALRGVTEPDSDSH